MLFAARDRFGIKPLFYADHKGTLYLASEVKALFAAGVPGALESRGDRPRRERLGGHPAQTLYEGVSQVPPGHYLLATAAGTHAAPLLGLRLSARRGRVARACGRRERRAAPRGARRGGAAAAAGRRAGRLLSERRPRLLRGPRARRAASVEPIRAFTLTFDRPDYDESAIAREMAAHAGAEFYPMPIRQDDLADHFSDATWHAETLCFNAHGVAKYLL